MGNQTLPEPRFALRDDIAMRLQPLDLLFTISNDPVDVSTEVEAQELPPGGEPRIVRALRELLSEEQSSGI